MKAHSSNWERRITKLQIVPWFNKKEWQETYEQAYSMDLELQEKAYTQMCIWKARFPNLPLGVECTMSTLHVKLCDKPRDGVDSGTYKDKDLQLLYSTAVMRFLNQLTVLSDHKDSMYKVAQQHKLPDWLINLRHEAAHGNTVPALYLLRQAADIIMLWLKEHYWEAEKDVMEDVARSPEQDGLINRSKVMNLLQLWLVLKTNYWAGLKTIDKIANEDIRNQAMELAKEEGFGIKLPEESGGKRALKRKQSKPHNVEIEKEAEVRESEEYTHKIKTSFEPLLRRLFEPLKSKTHKKMQYQTCLIDCIVSFTGFCPPIEVEQLSEAELLEMMSLMGELWKEVVEGLQAQDLLHCLLQQLMSEKSQLMSGQLWLRLITQLIAGHPPPHPPGTTRLSQILAEALPCEVSPETLVRKANFHHAKHLRPIDLKPPSAKEIEVFQKLAKKVLENPTKLSIRYLHSLLSFWEPRLSWETREKLCALARIYNGQQPLRNIPSQVFTLASLLDQGLDISETQTGDNESEHLTDTSGQGSPWTLYSGDKDWSHCPLGALPW